MSTFDSPDYQNVVTLSSGPVSDAPDWQEVIVGPGGAPIGGGSGDLGPADFGYVGWTHPPFSFPATTTGTLYTAGHVYYGLIKAVTSATVTHMGIVTTGGTAGLTANENYLGLYSVTFSGTTPSTSTLLAATTIGALDAAFSGEGLFFAALATGVPVTAGTIYYAAFLYNASSNFSTVIGIGNAGVTLQHSSAPNGFVWSYTDGTGSHTVLPGTFTPAVAHSAVGLPYTVMY